jgi:hypothetical protein
MGGAELDPIWTATAVVVGSAYHKAIIEWLRSVSGID